MFAILILLAALPTCHISIGEQTVQVEIASTPNALSKGLMGRKHLPPDTGMLFVFESPRVLSFWMKDTEIPLSIAFFDEKKKLIDLYDMPVPASRGPFPTFLSSKPALYALEVPQNWFKERGIGKGMEFSFLDFPDRLELTK